MPSCSPVSGFPYHAIATRNVKHGGTGRTAWPAGRPSVDAPAHLTFCAAPKICMPARPSAIASEVANDPLLHASNGSLERPALRDQTSAALSLRIGLDQQAHDRCVAGIADDVGQRAGVDRPTRA